MALPQTCSNELPQRILVVDDSLLIHRLLDARLRELDVELCFITDGSVALEAARTGQPDLILLDAHVSGLSGFEVCSLLKNDLRTHDIPVIFLTAADHPIDKVRAFDLGAVDYIVKPFDPAELRARVRAALNTKALMDLLTSQARIDGLTGLHNRRYFDDRLSEELAACARKQKALGLLLVDIDRFKRINDDFGHPKGDQIARRFALILRNACRAYDVPCRYGGDEFAIILPGADSSATAECGHRILDTIHNDPELQNIVRARITASIGAVAAREGECLRMEQFVARADRALYASKSAGRDCFTLDEELPSAA